MGFTDDVRQALIDRIGPGRRYPNNKRMADDLGIDPSQLNRFLKRERGLNTESLGHILDRLGAAVVFGDEPADAAREVCFRTPGKTQAHAPDPQPGDYLAVPLVEPEVAATSSAVPEEAVRGWMLVWRHQESLRFRSNLVAVAVKPGDLSMTPTLHPGDIVVLDRSDRDPGPAGKIMLVREPGPGGEPLIRRVGVRRLENDMEFVFYPDNSREYPPATSRLERDCDGDVGRAISGAVVWAWNDMSQK